MLGRHSKGLVSTKCHVLLAVRADPGHGGTQAQIAFSGRMPLPLCWDNTSGRQDWEVDLAWPLPS